MNIASAKNRAEAVPYLTRSKVSYMYLVVYSLWRLRPTQKLSLACEPVTNDTLAYLTLDARSYIIARQ